MKTYWVGITDQRAIFVPRTKTYARKVPTSGIVSVPLGEVVYTAVPKHPITLTLPGNPTPLKLQLTYLPQLHGYADEFVAALRKPAKPREIV
jgi:hypothetical protein